MYICTSTHYLHTHTQSEWVVDSALELADEEASKRDARMKQQKMVKDMLAAQARQKALGQGTDDEGGGQHYGEEDEDEDAGRRAPARRHRTGVCVCV